MVNEQLTPKSKPQSEGEGDPSDIFIERAEWAWLIKEAYNLD